MSEQVGSFALQTDANGVALVTFSRPPVNAVSLSVYEDIGQLVTRVEADSAIRCVVLTAPAVARAWCGGADLNDFVGMDADARKQRYANINQQLPRFYRMERPVIAAINGAAIGIGMILAGLCDMRIAAEDANFACPEIDYGLVAGGHPVFALAGMPDAKIREMLYTGAKFTARELEPTGFFNYVLPRAEILPRAMELATQIARKSLPAIRARKVASSSLEGRTWEQAYLDAQELTAGLSATQDGQEGVSAFLQRRDAQVRDS